MSEPRVFVTGLTGFAGSHLAEHLLRGGWETVSGTRRPGGSTSNVESFRGSLDLFEVDLRQGEEVQRVLREVQPDWVFHLAAQSNVRRSFEQPVETLESNVLGQLHLLEGLRRHVPGARVQIACSAAQYGRVEEEELPIREEAPPRPLSPYAVSKVSQDVLGDQYYRRYGMWIVRTRGFNHTGPRRPSDFVCSSFARQIARVEAGLSEPELSVGNLEARRDFTDVRDVVRGYVRSLREGRPGTVYNLCSGRAVRIEDVLGTLIEMRHEEIRRVRDPDRTHPAEVPVLRGSYERLRKHTGWEPAIPLERTLRDLLDFWREKVRTQA